jgi:hypothetical protein
MLTLTANLATILAGDLAKGYLRITLCGYGPQCPSVPGTCMLADAGVPQMVGPQIDSATPLSVELYGNDVISPVNTFYEVAVLDANQDVVQANNYTLTGSGTSDLSELTPIMPPYAFPIAALKYMPTTGALIGGNRIFNAPGPVIAATYNGIVLPDAATVTPGTLACTISGNVITLNFDPELGDRIDAFCTL